MTTKGKSTQAAAKNDRADATDNMAEQDRGDLAASAEQPQTPAPRADSNTDAGNVSPGAPVFPSSENQQQPIGTRPIGNQDNETPAMKIERERAEQDEAIRRSQAEARDRTEAESTPKQ